MLSRRQPSLDRAAGGLRSGGGFAPAARPTFDELYVAHVEFLWRNARRLGVGDDAVDDVLQQVFLVVHRRLADVALGAWLRTDPPRTGNEQLDKLIASGREKIHGIPLKMITVSTNPDTKKGKQTVTKMTMEVTELDATATVSGSSFEIPAGYQETQMTMPSRQGGQ